MNHELSQITSASPPADNTDNNMGEARKYITFKLADYLFALPSEDILKIVPTPPPSQGGMVSMGLVQLEQYSIQILNLTKLLGLKETTHTEEDLKATLLELTEAGSAENPPFLIVLQNVEQDLWGIAVDQPPDLMDIPNYALKPVPSEKRLTRTLRWVSHVVTYDLGGDRHTLLILDVSLLLAPKQAETDANKPNSLGIEPPLEPDNIPPKQEEMYA